MRSFRVQWESSCESTSRRRGEDGLLTPQLSAVKDVSCDRGDFESTPWVFRSSLGRLLRIKSCPATLSGVPSRHGLAAESQEASCSRNMNSSSGDCRARVKAGASDSGPGRLLSGIF